MDVDLLIIGGGITGAAVARDAAGRGLSVYLAERADYAAATSSASSKLIHGGLRYLGQREFALVREALRERSRLMRNAPHLVRALRFLMPLRGDSPYPPWQLRAGLALYDLFALGGGFPGSGRLPSAEAAGIPRLRQEGLRGVLHYPDAQADDARLVLANLLDARARGADVGNYRNVVDLGVDGDRARACVEHDLGATEVRARAVVNAAGPWVSGLLDGVGGPPLPPARRVRGSHILVPAPEGAGGDACTLWQPDGRVVFVVPWPDGFLMIGTTDVVHDGPSDDARCTDEERDYLLDACARYFAPSFTASDVVWRFAGLRVLRDDGADAPSRSTRRPGIDLRRLGPVPMVSVFGGKLTAHRAMAEHIVDALAGEGLAMAGAWTRDVPLHGGDIDRPGLAALERARERPAPAVRRRWVQTYGTGVEALDERIAVDPALAEEFVPGVPRAELEHARDEEDARCAEDFLWRRTRLGVGMDDATRARIEDWFRSAGVRSGA